MRHRNKRLKMRWPITIGLSIFYEVVAKTAGHAARLAFRKAIASGRIDRQPICDNDGGWQGVHIGQPK